jgi:transcription elongation GreA/GreB family factor
MILEALLKNAVIVSHKKTDTVSIGSSVLLEKDGSEHRYEIVGTEEADIDGVEFLEGLEIRAQIDEELASPRASRERPRYERCCSPKTHVAP